jgi:hypothetical protein
MPWLNARAFTLEISPGGDIYAKDNRGGGRALMWVANPTPDLYRLSVNM